MAQSINVYSEIGKLNKVLLHRPEGEIEGLVPDNFEVLLFDDIPYLKLAQQEHDCFANILRENGAEVVLLKDAIVGSLQDKTVRNEFLERFISESGVPSYAASAVWEFLNSKTDLNDLVSWFFRGVSKEDVPLGDSFTVNRAQSDLFYMDPLPNLYYTRDPGACVGNGVSVNSMNKIARQRESLFMEYILKYNKDVFPAGTQQWYKHDGVPSIEGGDILVLSDKVVAVGLSERTKESAIEIFAKNLLSAENSYEKVVVIEIPPIRAFMHLDTVFTMVDYDKFTIHPEITETLSLYELTLGADGEIKYTSSEETLNSFLKRVLNLPAVDLFNCGGDSTIAAMREQWNDGANTLAIAPGKVVVYDRNYVTNELLDKHGITVIETLSSELSRGRGGPRCMSMPLNRDSIL